MRISTLFAACLCLCLLIVASWADAAVTRTRTRSTCSSGQCSQAAAPRVYRSTQTTRTQTTVRRSR